MLDNSSKENLIKKLSHRFEEHASIINFLSLIERGLYHWFEIEH